MTPQNRAPKKKINLVKSNMRTVLFRLHVVLCCSQIIFFNVKMSYVIIMSIVVIK